MFYTCKASKTPHMHYSCGTICHEIHNETTSIYNNCSYVPEHCRIACKRIRHSTHHLRMETGQWARIPFTVELFKWKNMYCWSAPSQKKSELFIQWLTSAPQLQTFYMLIRTILSTFVTSVLKYLINLVNFLKCILCTQILDARIFILIVLA